MSIVISPFSFLILLIWFFSIFSWWIWLKVCNFVYLLKEPAFSFINLDYCFYLPFGFCLHKFSSVVCVNFMLGVICAFILVGGGDFPSSPPCTGLCEVVILSADDCVCIFVLFIVWVRHPAQGAVGSCVLLGVVYKWLPLCKFSLINPP